MGGEVTDEKPDADKPTVIGLQEIADKIGVAYETARRWAAAGMIPAFKFHEGGHWVAHASDIDEFVKRRKNPTRPVE